MNWRIRGVIALLVLVMTTACGADGTVKLAPPFLPIAFGINSKGDVTVSYDKSFVTPLGRITLGADLPVVDEAEGHLLVVQQRVASRDVRDLYTLRIEGNLAACLNGRFHLGVSGNTITLVLLTQVSRFWLVAATDDPRSACPPEPGITRAVPSSSRPRPTTTTFRPTTTSRPPVTTTSRSPFVTTTR
ncbi:hypothetical protein [Allokutzneria albata]|uniref:Uncharacterized protein n=1 Tax=Allokutzneria albata TaxID=211114 RepID=A0A1H0BUG7_ALLAB|nr:hypothetical protein [Allokutzneria albata]SDN49248.1 hypothetical protein SAMN04489726_6849 [Allokutzneria albata]